LNIRQPVRNVARFDGASTGHAVLNYSPDMEYLEIVSPADFKTIDMPPATDAVPR
jgi:hypothetical protein